MTRLRRRRHRHRGAGLVETMVGILVGMLVVLVVYNVFALAVGYARTAVGAADAQNTGLYAQFVLAREIASAGNGVLASGVASIVASLQRCANNDPGWRYPAPFDAGLPLPAIRPTPVLIHDGGAPNVSDSVIVTYSAAPRVTSPVQVVDAAVTGVAPFYVQSPNGFRSNDLAVVVDPGTRACELTTVTGVVAGDSKGDATTGVVTVSHPAVAGTYAPGTPADGAMMLNLGQAGEAVRTLYDVASGQLRSTDLLAAAPANPVAQNIVLMKAQYGVDCANDGAIVWTAATDSDVCGLGDGYTEGQLFKVPSDPTSNDSRFGAAGSTIARIRAIRVGVVARSDEPDLKNNALIGQSAVLFDCATHDAACQGRIVLDDTVLSDRYRFRIYETVIPMRNAIWNTGT